MVFGHNVEVRRAVLHVGIVVALIGMAARIQVDRGQPPGAYGATMQSPLVPLAITLGCLALVVAAFLVRRLRISTTATS